MSEALHFQGEMPDPKEPFMTICGLDARTRLIEKRQYAWWAARVSRKAVKRSRFISMSNYRRRIKGRLFIKTLTKEKHHDHQ